LFGSTDLQISALIATDLILIDSCQSLDVTRMACALVRFDAMRIISANSFLSNNQNGRTRVGIKSARLDALSDSNSTENVSIYSSANDSRV
jgi:hypothetical protein